MNFIKNIQRQPWYIKLTHWEYWSFNTVYYPIVWYWLWLGIKARSFFFFNASNPSIAFGGFLMESKWDIAKILPETYTPQTSIIRKNDSPQLLLQKVKAFEFPIICKPDMSSRGRGVAVIHNEQELLAYQQQCPLDFLLQEKINYPLEAGIFYVRMPGEESGIITGIVEKEFMTIQGNGFSSIRELVLLNDRFLLQLKPLELMLGQQMNEVLLKGEQRILVPFGNHARGCRFIDGSQRINEQLTRSLDAVCSQVPGFYYGRLDIRFESWKALERGDQFSIIELNGSGSEPTHIYDERWTIFRAWKEIIRHWKWLHKVSVANHKQGAPYLSLADSRKMFRDNKEIDRLMEGFTYVAPGKQVPEEVG